MHYCSRYFVLLLVELFIMIIQFLPDYFQVLIHTINDYDLNCSSFGMVLNVNRV